MTKKKTSKKGLLDDPGFVDKGTSRVMKRISEFINNDGAPTKYQASFVESAKFMAMNGATVNEMAQVFQVDERTIRNWRNSYPDFAEALKVGRDLADDRVQRSLYERAVGYTYEAEKIFHNSGDIVRAEAIEHIPPDVSAATQWLKNRRPEEWRDRREVKIEASDGLIEALAEARKRIQENVIDVEYTDESSTEGT